MTDLQILHPGRSIRSEIRRLATSLLDDALTHLGEAESDLNPAVDAICDRVSTIRGILRLVRYDIGSKAFDVEDDRMREVLRLIDPIHQSGLLIARTEELASRRRKDLERLEVDVLVARLEARHLELAFALAQSSTLGEIEGRLGSARQRIDRLPLSSGGFPPVRPGFERVAERGLRRMIRAHEKPTGKRIFSWSRQVGYLHTHIRLLSGAWPEVLDPLAEESGRLVRLLRDDRELGRLADAIRRDRSLAPKPLRRSLVEMIGEERSGLLREAWDLGARLYAEPPHHLVARIGRVWMQG